MIYDENHDLTFLSKEYIKIFHTSENFKKIINDKIVVDMGSGYGELVPFISFFSPKNIISVEPSTTMLDIQKDFLSNKFTYLKKKQIENITFHNETVEEFRKNNINFDTIGFFDSLYLINEFFTEEEQRSTVEYNKQLLNYMGRKKYYN